MDINQIIGKFFSGKSGDEELGALEDWQNEAQENIKALEEMKKIAALSDGLKGYEDFNAEDAWDSFEDKIDSAEDDNSDSKVFTLNKWIKVAAVLVVLFGSLHVIRNGIDVGPSISTKWQTYASNESKFNIDLRDGTEMILDAASTVKELGERSVRLEGKAYFSVAKSEKNQFRIKMPVGDITVLGTQFTVTAQSDYTEIFVEEGRVEYKLTGAKTQILGAGDLLKVRNNEPVLIKNQDRNYSSWRLDRFVFNDDTMQEVINTLSRHYKTEITLDNPKQFAKCSFNTRIENQSLEEVLNEFRISHGLTYNIKDGKYIVVSCSC